MILLKENAVMTTNRKAHTIYIDDLLYNEITNVPELANYSFSKKVSFILQKYLDDQNNKENKKKPLSQEKNQKIRFIDLFAGIGGIRLGFEGHSHDTECVYSSEWDKYAQKTYEANFGDKPDGDITKVKAKDIPDFDVLLAGFPCQPFSSIGKREGFANKTQGTLFFDILRILKYHMPSAFLLENVPGLLTIQHGETFNIIINALKESGYSVHSKVLEASNFGLAQSRKRVIIVGFRNDIDDSKFIIPEGNGKNTYVKDILEDNPQGYTISKRLQQNYLFKKDEMEAFIKSEPESAKYFHPWYGAEEFIHQRPRYCLWLGDCSPAELRKMPHALKRVENVRNLRLASKSAGTRKLADKPTRFHVENFPQGDYIIIPSTSSERRSYIPMGYLDSNCISSNAVHIIPDASLYHFGVLESSVHMAWMRVVCGRLESRYRYSKEIVYNNFPWPKVTEAQKAKIESTAQAILDARSLYPDSSLADLYDDVTMPIELRKAHTANDIAVLEAYGLPKSTAEPAIVAHLFTLTAH